MSHSVLYVITKDKPRDIEKAVAIALAPFDENLDVPEYERDCYCVGRIARKEIDKQLDHEFGDRDARLKAFDERHPEFKNVDLFSEGNEKVEDTWQLEVVKPLLAREKELLEQHPGRNDPDPTCGFYTQDFLDRYPNSAAAHKVGDRYEDGSGCGGTGKETSTYNPKSKWDWYSIGGRWAGRFDNGREWISVASLLALNDAAFKEIVPFSLLTPEGEWHEKGKMGWFGMVSDRKPRDEWHQEVRSLLEEVVKVYPDAHAINVDVHI